MAKFYALRLQPFTDLKDELNLFCQQKGLPSGVLVSCVGSLSRLNLRLAGGKTFLTKPGHFEIISLAGTISADGSHLHICVAAEDGGVLGGHLLSGNIIDTTAEIVLAELENTLFVREFDKETGYNELRVLET